MVQITHTTTDIVLDRFDTINILDNQASSLINFLPNNFVIFEPFPTGGQAPAGSYTKIYSPVFTSDDDVTDKVKTILDGIHEFINDLNSNGKTIGCIECYLEQSDDLDAVPHPINNVTGNLPTNPKYIQNGDCKNCNWIFSDMFMTYDRTKVYGNKFNREINNLSGIIKKKYYTLRIESPWLSI